MVDYKNAFVAVTGYVISFLIPLIGFLYGLILFYFKKDDPFYNRQSKFIMIFAIFMWVLNIILVFAFR